MSPDEKDLIESFTAGAVSGVLEPVKKPIENVLDGPTKELGLFLTQVARSFRHKALETMRRAKKRLKDRNAPINPVPNKILIPLLESSCLEDDENMTDRWVSLLAAAADGNSKDEVLPSFSTILSELSPKEAELLEFAYDTFVVVISEHSGLANHFLAPDDLKEPLGLSEKDLRILLDNLHRLRLIELKYNAIFETKENRDADSDPTMSLISQPPNVFALTWLGIAFIKACRHGRPVDPIHTSTSTVYSVQANGMLSGTGPNADRISRFKRK